MTTTVWGAIPFLIIVALILVVGALLALVYAAMVGFSVAFVLSTEFELPSSYRALNLTASAVVSPFMFGLLVVGHWIFSAQDALVLVVPVGLHVVPALTALASTFLFVGSHRMTRTVAPSFGAR